MNILYIILGCIGGLLVVAVTIIGGLLHKMKKDNTTINNSPPPPYGPQMHGKYGVTYMCNGHYLFCRSNKLFILPVSVLDFFLYCTLWGVRFLI